MLSKNKIKFFNSLKLRKNRLLYNLFVAEGEKIVSELLKTNIKPEFIITSKEYSFLNNLSDTEIIFSDYKEIKKISSLKTPQSVIGIFGIPKYDFDINEIKSSLCLFCDGIQNPGNLGTIIRTADWFGIKHVFCSEDTVDVYNPKTIQATTGAVASVKTFYINPDDFFSFLPNNFPVYGMFLSGKNIYETKSDKKGVIVIGNEGNGISRKTEKYINEKLFIPSFNTEKSTESLNASVAAAVVCSEFLRRQR